MTQSANDTSRRAEEPLKGLAEVKKAADNAKGLPPVHLWNPPFCGDLDMRIGADGTWYYMKTPIGRKRLRRLFSTVLRRDEDGKYYLVTPVEKCGITVDDAPFVAVAMEVEGTGREQTLKFVTNVEDEVIAGPDHPLRFENESGTEGLKPYVHVRGRLEALVNRAVFYDLAEIGSVEPVEGEEMYGVWSGGEFFSIMPAKDLDL